VAHTIRDKKPLLTRLRRINGQVQALERALDQEVGCVAVLQQIAAIRGAVNGLMAHVVEGHLREHVRGDDRAAASEADKVISVVCSYLK
jgi:DNA-binding FrmR family transcriptional regulator